MEYAVRSNGGPIYIERFCSCGQGLDCLKIVNAEVTGAREKAPPSRSAEDTRVRVYVPYTATVCGVVRARRSFSISSFQFDTPLVSVVSAAELNIDFGIEPIPGVLDAPSNTVRFFSNDVVFYQSKWYWTPLSVTLYLYNGALAAPHIVKPTDIGDEPPARAPLDAVPATLAWNGNRTTLRPGGYSVKSMDQRAITKPTTLVYCDSSRFRGAKMLFSTEAQLRDWLNGNCVFYDPLA